MHKRDHFQGSDSPMREQTLVPHGFDYDGDDDDGGDDGYSAW